MSPFVAANRESDGHDEPSRWPWLATAGVVGAVVVATLILRRRSK